MHIPESGTKPTALFTFKPIKQQLEVKHAILTSIADPKDIKAKPSFLTYEKKNLTSNSQDNRYTSRLKSICYKN